MKITNKYFLCSMMIATVRVMHGSEEEYKDFVETAKGKVQSVYEVAKDIEKRMQDAVAILNPIGKKVSTLSTNSKGDGTDLKAAFTDIKQEMPGVKNILKVVRMRNQVASIQTWELASPAEWQKPIIGYVNGEVSKVLGRVQGYPNALEGSIKSVEGGFEGKVWEIIEDYKKESCEPELAAYKEVASPDYPSDLIKARLEEIKKMALTNGIGYPLTYLAYAPGVTFLFDDGQKVLEIVQSLNSEKLEELKKYIKEHDQKVTEYIEKANARAQ